MKSTRAILPVSIAALLSLVGLLVSTSHVSADETEVVPAERMKAWKPTKSITAPPVEEKIRKGLGVETGPEAASALGTANPTPAMIEVKVDANSAFAFQNIQFGLNRAELVGETTYRQLAEIAKAMAAAGGERFLVEGHTCDLGEEAANFDLSRRRALSVRDVLVGLGVSPERIVVLGCGESNRLVKDTTESARAQNRRVEIYRKL